jgi:hypothetical protein
MCKFEKIDVKKLNAEETPTINTHKNIIKNKHKCPQKPTIPCHYPLDQVKTSELELDKAALVEEIEELNVLQEEP